MVFEVVLLMIFCQEDVCCMISKIDGHQSTRSKEWHVNISLHLNEGNVNHRYIKWHGGCCKNTRHFIFMCHPMIWFLAPRRRLKIELYCGIWTVPLGHICNCQTRSYKSPLRFCCSQSHCNTSCHQQVAKIIVTWIYLELLFMHFLEV